MSYYQDEYSQQILHEFKTSLFLNGTGGFSVMKDKLHDTIQPNKAYTISVWVNPTIAPSNEVVLSRDVLASGIGIRFSPTGIQGLFGGTSLTATNYPSNVVANRWSHIVITCEGTGLAGSAKLYVNGRLQESSLAYIPSADFLISEQLHIGKSNTDTFRYNGLLNNLVILNKAINTVELQTLNNDAGIVYEGLQDSLIAYYPFSSPNVSTYDVGQSISVTAADSNYAASAADAGLAIGDGKHGDFSVRMWHTPDAVGGTSVSYGVDANNYFQLLPSLGFNLRKNGNDTRISAFPSYVADEGAFVGIDVVSHQNKFWRLSRNGEYLDHTVIFDDIENLGAITDQLPGGGILSVGANTEDGGTTFGGFSIQAIAEVSIYKPFLSKTQSDWLYNNGQGNDPTSKAAINYGIGILGVHGTIDANGVITFTDSRVNTLLCRHLKFNEGEENLETVTGNANYLTPASATASALPTYVKNKPTVNIIEDISPKYNEKKTGKWYSWNAITTETGILNIPNGFKNSGTPIPIWKVEDGTNTFWYEDYGLTHDFGGLVGDKKVTQYVDFGTDVASFSSITSLTKLDLSGMQNGRDGNDASTFEFIPNLDEIVFRKGNMGGACRNSAIPQILEYDSSFHRSGQLFWSGNQFIATKFDHRRRYNSNSFTLSDNDLRGNLDLRAWFFNGALNIGGNSDLDTVIFRDEEMSLSLFNFLNNNFSGSVIFPNITINSTTGSLLGSGCANLTSFFLHPTNLHIVRNLQFDNTGLGSGGVPVDFTWIECVNNGAVSFNNIPASTVNFKNVAQSTANIRFIGAQVTSQDISMFTITGSVQFRSMPNIVTLNLGTNANSQTATNSVIDIYDCPQLTSGINLSTWTNLIGFIRVYQNPLMPSLTLGTGSPQDFRAYECPALAAAPGNLDFGGIDFNSTNLIRLEACTAPAATVNTWLDEINNRITGPTSINILIGGTGATANAPVDSVSGGVDGLAAVAAIQGKGGTVNHN